MKIFVCLKPVIDPAFVKYDAESGMLSSRHYKLNKYDFYSIKEAMALKKRSSAHISAVCIAPTEKEEYLKKAFFLGVDEGYRIWDPILDNFGHLDSWQKANLLARFFQKRACDLIFCGSRSEDWNSGFLGACLSEQLGLPFISGAIAIEHQPQSELMIVHKKMEKRWVESFEVRFPAVIAMEQSKYEPKYFSPLKRETTVINFVDLGIDKLVSPLIWVSNVTEIRPRMKIMPLTNKLSLTEKLRLVSGELGEKKGEVAEVSGENGAKIIYEKIRNILGLAC